MNYLSGENRGATRSPSFVCLALRLHGAAPGLTENIKGERPKRHRRRRPFFPPTCKKLKGAASADLDEKLRPGLLRSLPRRTEATPPAAFSTFRADRDTVCVCLLFLAIIQSSFLWLHSSRPWKLSHALSQGQERTKERAIDPGSVLYIW